MNDPIVVTKNLIRRGWSDFEPKLVTALLSGSAATVLVGIAHDYGIKLPETAAQGLPLVLAGLIGYLTPSVGVTVSRKVEGNGYEQESHSGNPVTTVTAPTAAPTPSREARRETLRSMAREGQAAGLTDIPNPLRVDPTVKLDEPNPSTPIQQTSPGIFTKVIQPSEDDKETVQLPPYSRGQSIMDTISRNAGH